MSKGCQRDVKRSINVNHEDTPLSKLVPAASRICPIFCKAYKMEGNLQKKWYKTFNVFSADPTGA